MNGVTRIYAEARVNTIHQYRVQNKKCMTRCHKSYFFASNQFNYIASDNTLETVYASGGFCLT